MVIEPLRQVGGATDDHGAALASLPGYIQCVSVLIPGDVLELEVTDFCNPASSLPQNGNKGFIARVMADAQEGINVSRGEEVLALQLLLIAFPHMCRDPGDHGWHVARRGKHVGSEYPRHEVLQDGLVRAKGLRAVRWLLGQEARNEMLNVGLGKLIKVLLEEATKQQQDTEDTDQAHFPAHAFDEARITVS